MEQLFSATSDFERQNTDEGMGKRQNANSFGYDQEENMGERQNAKSYTPDNLEGGKRKKSSKKGSKKLSKGGADRVNPIVLAAQIATALFKEFGEQTDELNAKGQKKWKLPDIKDGIPFRTTLGKILKENDGDVDKAIDDAKKRYKSGALQKAVKATADQQQQKKSSKGGKKHSKKVSKKASKKVSKKSSKKMSKGGKKASKKASKKTSKKTSKKSKKH